MKVLVATTNNAKIEGIKRAFNTYFNDVEILGIKTNSEVSDQPVNLEIKQGAENRLINLKKYLKENNVQYDYCVSVEAGITDYFEEWINIQIVMIEDKSKKMGMGTSSGYNIPKRYIEEIKEKNLAEVTNKIFGYDEKRHQQKGTIQLLTKNKVSRDKLIEEATIMALTKFINDDKWSD